MSDKTKVIEVLTFMAVLVSGSFTAWTWFDTDRELSKTNTTLSKAQVSLLSTESRLAEVQARLFEIKIAVAEVSEKNLALENTLLDIEIATRPKRDQVALAKEVREAVMALTPRTDIGGGNVSMNDYQSFLAWEIKNIGQTTVEVVLLELMISQDTPLLFNSGTKIRGARLYDEMAGKLPIVSKKKYKSVSYYGALDKNLVPTVVFAYPSLIPPDGTLRMNLPFSVDSPKVGVTYHYRAIFGVRSAPSEIDYYLSILEPDESTEARLYDASRRLFFSSGSFKFASVNDNLVTIDRFITDHNVKTTPNRTNIEIAQFFLNELGFMAGAVDGELGPTTKAAIVKFQRTKELPSSGQLDIRTLTFIRNEMSKISE